MINLLIIIFEMCLLLIVKFFMCFAKYVEFFDMSLIGITSLFFFSQKANIIFPDVISVAIGATISITLVLLYWKLYKESVGFWLLRIISSAIWGVIAFFATRDLFRFEKIDSCYLWAVIFGLWSFLWHFPSVREKLMEWDTNN